MLARALLECLAGLCRRQESFIGARGPWQRDIERLLVRFVDIDDGAVRDLGRPAMTGGSPVGEELAVARCCVSTRIDQKISRVDCIARAEFERLRIAAHHPERRMRLLHRLHREQRAFSPMNVALKGERLRLAIGSAQVVDEFERRRFAQVVVEAERLEIVRVDAGDEAELHAAADHLIDEGDFLCQSQRMIERHDVAHRPDTDLAGARGGADDVDAGGGNPALVRAEMVLDAERVVVTKFVAQLKFAPQLLIALVRCHAWLAPDMRKMGKLHYVFSLRVTDWPSSNSAGACLSSYSGGGRYGRQDP